MSKTAKGAKKKTTKKKVATAKAARKPRARLVGPGEMTIRAIVESALATLAAENRRMGLHDFGRWVGRTCSRAQDAGALEDFPRDEDLFTETVVALVVELDPNCERVLPPLDS